MTARILVVMSLTILAAVISTEQQCWSQSPLLKLPTDEFKAVKFSGTEEEDTKRLNDLAADGWEYVGALTNGNVAFRRTEHVGKRVRLIGSWEAVTDNDDEKGQFELHRDNRVTLVDGNIRPLQAVFESMRGPDELRYEIGEDGRLALVEGRGKAFASISFGGDMMKITRAGQNQTKTFRRIK